MLPLDQQDQSDYLMRFGSEAAFNNFTLPDGAKVNPVRAVTARAEYDGETQTSPQTYAPGYWVQIYHDEDQDDLASDNRCQARGRRRAGTQQKTIPRGFGIVAVDGLYMGSEISL